MFTRVCLLLTIILTGCAVFKKGPTKGNPPGTLKINDTLYIDKTEIPNVGWREYLFYLSNMKKDEYEIESALPDTSVWNDIKGKPDTSNQIQILNNPFVEYYFRHPGYNNYPVVGISYEQAVEYCKWRTHVANQADYFRSNNIKDYKNHLQDTFPIRYYYRLPTQEEWEMVASGNLTATEHPYGYKDVYTKWRGKKSKMFNCIFPGDNPHPSDLHSPNVKTYTADVKAFLPNIYNVYNMIGNIAEMISEKGVAKGGSFIHPLDSCKVSINQYYSKPEMWLGFRCVAVKIK
jgi:formylglycine-generating enzyme required for sulfatase activity